MSNYPYQNSSGYPYGGPPSGRPPQNSFSLYFSVSYPYSSPSAVPGGWPQSYGGYHTPLPSAQYGSSLDSLVPSDFPPGTDPNVIACFKRADEDGNGFIDDKELQRALSTSNQTFALRTVHLLMQHFTNSNVRKIGPKEFTQVFYSLQRCRALFERFDMDKSGTLNASELRNALLSLGFSGSPVILDLLVSKFDNSGGRNVAIEYDSFIECCLTIMLRHPLDSLVQSDFPPGTDPNVIACFQRADEDGSGFIDDKELQRALSTSNQIFELRTVHLLMYYFTKSNVRKIGPKEFTQVFYSLQSWRALFDRFDRDKSGKLDASGLRAALLCLGFSVSPVVLDLLVSKFVNSGGRNKAIEYDSFIDKWNKRGRALEELFATDPSYWELHEHLSIPEVSLMNPPC